MGFSGAVVGFNYKFRSKVELKDRPRTNFRFSEVLSYTIVSLQTLSYELSITNYGVVDF